MLSTIQLAASMSFLLLLRTTEHTVYSGVCQLAFYHWDSPSEETHWGKQRFELNHSFRELRSGSVSFFTLSLRQVELWASKTLSRGWGLETPSNQSDHLTWLSINWFLILGSCRVGSQQRCPPEQMFVRMEQGLSREGEMNRGGHHCYVGTEEEGKIQTSA